MNRYHVTVQPGERYWILNVEGIGLTQARSLAEVNAMAEDLIAAMADDHNVALDIDLRLPDSVQHHLTSAHMFRQQESDARSAAAQETRAAARELSSTGLALRQIGEVLGVSRQRVHQMLNA